MGIANYELTKQTIDLSAGETDLDHTYCMVCYPDPDTISIALCGTDVTNVPEGWYESGCVVCEELTPLPCPKCGN